ncbi:MAG TPA: universal stress protein [Bacteroidia bacterium]|jgi:nucleotide-binding universal stress UspA family protein|nr:universal stress protein [Bacteroidia bacterium]
MKNNFHILTATDYSTAVKNAERYSLQLAHAENAGLTFLHIYPALIPPPFPAYDMMIPGIDALPEEQKILELYVDKMRMQLKFGGDVDISCRVREGTVTEEIVAEAEQAHVNLILIGTHEPGSFPGSLWAGHTWSTIRNSPCPVLSIPEDALFKPVQKIAYLTEYKEEEIPAIRYLCQHVERIGASLAVLHISPFQSSMPLESIVFENFLKELGAKLSNHKFGFSLLHGEDPVKVLNDFCAGEGCDWLAMSAGKSSLFTDFLNPYRKLTKQMSFHTHIPLLTIPVGYSESEIIAAEEEWVDHVES